MMRKPIVFTDLDGTLLDHDTYRFDDALEMIEYLKTRAIPLIIVTSKTKPEVTKLQRRLGIHEPFIIENGAGIIIPQQHPLSAHIGAQEIPMGKAYSEISHAFAELKRTFRITGFCDMSIEEVAQATGLPPEQARDAKQRTFTEPFILHEPEKLDALKNAAKKRGLDIVRGGRFFHLITRGQDKANAINHLVRRYEELFQGEWLVIALGDGPNDLSMLAAADRPVLIPHPGMRYEPFTAPDLIRAPYSGPKGWSAALKEILFE